MNNKIFNYFELAAKKAKAKDDGRTFFLCAVGVRYDQTVRFATNIVSDIPNRRAHAEARLARMLDYGATVYIVRVRADLSYGMAKPCTACQKILVSRKIKKAYYSISDNEFGVWDVDSGVDNYYNRSKDFNPFF